MDRLKSIARMKGTGSWVKVTENHHENRMHGIHFGSKHPLHQLLALFSSSRTRPGTEVLLKGRFCKMKHRRLFAALAVLCLLAGSAFAVAKLMPAVVDDEKCMGCGTCAETCPVQAISLNDQGIAVVDKEKCTGCKKCINVCPNEAISAE